MADRNQLLEEIKAKAEKLLIDLNATLPRLELEIRSGQTRSFQTSDFLIAEFRRLAAAVEALAAALKSLK